jgi:hypothetical protein
MGTGPAALLPSPSPLISPVVADVAAVAEGSRVEAAGDIGAAAAAAVGVDVDGGVLIPPRNRFNFVEEGAGIESSRRTPNILTKGDDRMLPSSPLA